jgi:hypothetical protein
MIRKRIVFACLAIAFAAVGALGVLLAADVRLHHRLERSAGVNIWGYRGPTVPRKQSGEHRLVVLGGSTAFGYGVNWNEAFPAQLETELRALSRHNAPVRVVNLGFNAQGAYAFVYGLQAYSTLDYDAAILYEGYNDVNGPNQFIGRRDSLVFRLVGYYPILSTALQEKAMALRNGGDLNAAYRGRTVFRPGLASRSTAAALDAAAQIGITLHEQLDRFAKAPPAPKTFAEVRVEDVGCAMIYAHYCAAVDRAIRYLLDHGKKALVVTQPYISDGHRAQQAQLRAMLAARFGGNPSVGYADLGNAIDMEHSRMTYDTMHLTPEGNAAIARQLIAPVAALMPEAFDAPEAAASRQGTE